MARSRRLAGSLPSTFDKKSGFLVDIRGEYDHPHRPQLIAAPAALGECGLLRTSHLFHLDGSKLPGRRLQQAGALHGLRRAAFLLQGQTAEARGDRPQASVTFVDERFFETVGQAVLQGRNFTEDDKPGGEIPLIVNQSLASHHWPLDTAVGKLISFDNGQNWARIVGVVANARQQLNRGARPIDPFLRFTQARKNRLPFFPCHFI